MRGIDVSSYIVSMNRYTPNTYKCTHAPLYEGGLTSCPCAFFLNSAFPKFLFFISVSQEEEDECVAPEVTTDGYAFQISEDQSTFDF